MLSRLVWMWTVSKTHVLSNQLMTIRKMRSTLIAPLRRFESDVRSEKDARATWRKKAPFGKFHNLIRHSKASPAHRYYFESKQKEVDPVLPVCKLVTDGGIQWNSTHDMTERALKLKDALKL